MEGSEGLALAAVQAMTAVATGAGTAVGQAVGEVVRARLARLPAGRAAVDGLDQSPQDVAAADMVRGVLQEELAGDPEFTERLRHALVPPQPSFPPHHTSGSIVVGSSRLRGSHLALGPLTISNVRNSKGALGGFAAVAVLVLALALYGGVQLATGGDRDPQGWDPLAPKPSAGSVALRDASQVLPVLPAPGSLPTGWSVKSGFPGTMQCPSDGPGCAGTSISAVAEYTPAGEVDQVRIELRSYPTPDAAAQGYEALVRQQKNRGSGLDPISLPDVGGDESMAVSWAIHPSPGMTEATGATSVVRVGTVAATVYLRDEGAGGTDLDVLQALTAAMAARIGEAVSGQEPQSTIHL
ncbi:hypothetical protein [Streptomyces sp. NPDC005533]|uniref:hypothetical protein n=1 Tax=Streptomyces sp. NPDC005533 TaxID=3364723 RepID=UPI003694EF55